MKPETFILTTRPTETQAISIEEFRKRKIQRRRRVAKRKLKAVPLFAVEEMQAEFPGYTYEEFIADVTRKTRKSKTFRRPKPRKFDWRMIYKEAPELFRACKKRTPTSATIRFKLKSGLDFTCIVRSSWFDGQRQCRFHTLDFIKLWRGTIQEFVKHPAVIVKENNNEIKPAETAQIPVASSFTTKSMVNPPAQHEYKLKLEL